MVWIAYLIVELVLDNYSDNCFWVYEHFDMSKKSFYGQDRQKARRYDKLQPFSFDLMKAMKIAFCIPKLWAIFQQDGLISQNLTDLL